MGRRLEGDRDDVAEVVRHDREVGGTGIRLGRVAQAGEDAEEEIVLGLVRAQEVAGCGQECIDS